MTTQASTELNIDGKWYRAGQWVSIEDRIPHDGWEGKVLHSYGTETARMRAPMWWCFTDDREVCVWACGVTHWLDTTILVEFDPEPELPAFLLNRNS